MSDIEKPIFSVDTSAEPVVVRIDGRASYLTSAPVNQLFTRLLDQGRRFFLVDFRNCTGMDSTFLGILAGTAIRIRRETPEGRLDLCNLSERNFELVRNLGLHRILNVIHEPTDAPSVESSSLESLGSDSVSSKMMLEAHRNLLEADADNAGKFEDVIEFLEKDIE